MQPASDAAWSSSKASSARKQGGELASLLGWLAAGQGGPGARAPEQRPFSSCPNCQAPISNKLLDHPLHNLTPEREASLLLMGGRGRRSANATPPHHHVKPNFFDQAGQQTQRVIWIQRHLKKKPRSMTLRLFHWISQWEPSPTRTTRMRCSKLVTMEDLSLATILAQEWFAVRNI